MMKEEDRFSVFLEYSQLIYNYLSVHHIDQLSKISACRWIRGSEMKKSTFKYQENLLCLAGSEDTPNTSKGILAIYYTKIPSIQDLDDNRIRPSMTIKNRYQFANPIKYVQEFANLYPNSNYNNCLAISTKSAFQVMVMPLNSLISENKNIINQKAEQFLLLKGHSDQITRIKWANFANSGFKLFTSSQDKSIIQWDIEKMKLQRQMKYHRDTVNDITVLHNYTQKTWGDGPQIDNPQIVATVSSDGYVFLWDSKQKNPINRINCKQKQLYSVACVSKNSILTGGCDGNIKFWDLRQHREYPYDSYKEKCEGHKGKITKIELIRPLDYQIKESQNPNIGKIRYASGGSDGRIIIWQEKIHFVHQGHQNEITDFDYQYDSNFYASVSGKIPRLMIWQEGVCLGPLQK